MGPGRSCDYDDEELDEKASFRSPWFLGSYPGRGVADVAPDLDVGCTRVRPTMNSVCA